MPVTHIAVTTSAPAPSPTGQYRLAAGSTQCELETDAGATGVWIQGAGSCAQAGQFLAQATGAFWQPVTAMQGTPGGLPPMSDTVCAFEGQPADVTIIVVLSTGDNLATNICEDLQASGWLPAPEHGNGY